MEPISSLRDILSSQLLIEYICDNLTFQEANELRLALKLPSLPCKYIITDSDGIIKSIPYIDNTTTQVAKLVTENGTYNGLLEAVYYGKLQAVRYFFDILHATFGGAVIFGRAIERAISFGRLPILKFFLDQRTLEDDPLFLLKEINDGLISAIREKNLEAIRMLVEAGANVNYRNPQGPSPLSAAIQVKNAKIVEYLIEHGLKLNPEFFPLIEAASYGTPEIIRILVKAGGQINEKSSRETPLLAAIKHKAGDNAEALLEMGADVNLREPIYQFTPLIEAVSRGWVRFATKLLDRGANIHAVESDGRNALFYAAETGIVEAVKLLIDRGAKLDNIRYKELKETLQYERVGGKLSSDDKKILKMVKSTFHNH